MLCLGLICELNKPHLKLWKGRLQDGMTFHIHYQQKPDRMAGEPGALMSSPPASSQVTWEFSLSFLPAGRGP